MDLSLRENIFTECSNDAGAAQIPAGCSICDTINHLTPPAPNEEEEEERWMWLWSLLLALNSDSWETYYIILCLRHVTPLFVFCDLACTDNYVSILPVIVLHILSGYSWMIQRHWHMSLFSWRMLQSYLSIHWLHAGRLYIWRWRAENTDAKIPSLEVSSKCIVIDERFVWVVTAGRWWSVFPFDTPGQASLRRPSWTSGAEVSLCRLLF